MLKVIPEACRYLLQVRALSLRVFAGLAGDCVCPFIDNGDTRCANRLTFRNLAHVFACCADDYESCSIHQVLATEGRNRDQVRNTSKFLAAS